MKQGWECGQAGAENTQADLDNGPHAWLDIGPWQPVSVALQCELVARKSMAYMVRPRARYSPFEEFCID